MQGFCKFYIHLVHVAGFLCFLSHKKFLQPTVTKRKERRKLIYNPLTTAAASSHTNKGRREEGKLIYNPSLLPSNSSSCCHLNLHKQGDENICNYTFGILRKIFWANYFRRTTPGGHYTSTKTCQRVPAEWWYYFDTFNIGT